MKTYVLLFRAVNVGGRNILPMKDLVAILEKNNYRDIQTYIQSGNVVLKSQRKPDSDITSIIQTSFGFKPELIALDETEFMSALKNNPYNSNEGKTIHFYFCKDRPHPATDELESLRTNTEKYHIHGKILYLYAPDGIGRSRLVANIESCLGVPATGRNLNTIHRLQNMLREVT